MSDAIGTNRALIIGVGQDLPQTVLDAKKLHAVITDPSRCAFVPSNVELLVEKQARRDDILHALDALVEATRHASDGSVVLYFSGHGLRVENDAVDNYYLAPYGYDLKKLRKTFIHQDELASRLNAIRSERLLLLLDCCHAAGVGLAKAPGESLTPTAIPPEALALFKQGRGRMVIASSRSNEQSFAPRGSVSFFTRALIECLCGKGVARHDGFVWCTDLTTHASEWVPQWTKQEQHPTFEYAGEPFRVAYYAAQNFAKGDFSAKSLDDLGLPPITDAVIEECLRPAPQTKYEAKLEGDGAIAQGDGATAVGAGGVYVGGNSSGTIITGKTKSKR